MEEKLTAMKENREGLKKAREKGKKSLKPVTKRLAACGQAAWVWGSAQAASRLFAALMHKCLLSD